MRWNRVGVAVGPRWSGRVRSLSTSLEARPSTLESTEHQQSNSRASPSLKQESKKNYVPFDGEFIRSGKIIPWIHEPMQMLSARLEAQKRSLLVTGVEVIVEVRDARIPHTSTHPRFAAWRAMWDTHRIIFFTRKDLLNRTELMAVRDWTRESYLSLPKSHLFMEDARGKKEVYGPDQRIVSNLIRDLIRSGRGRCAPMKYAMLVGMPHAGKSALVHTMVKHKRKTQPTPKGGTHKLEDSVLDKHWLWEKPNIKLMDTPGVFPADSRLEADPEAVYKLAVCGALNLDAICAPEVGMDAVELARYLLYRLNQAGLMNYVELYRLKGPTDDPMEILNTFIDLNHIRKRVQRFLDDFNAGLHGSIILDDLKLLDRKRTPQRTFLL